MKTARVSMQHIVPDPQQPRKLFDPAELTALSENIKTIGQQVPVIVYEEQGKAILLDGERRWRAAVMAGLAYLLAIVLAERPTEAQLRVIQNSLDVHRVQLNPMERANLLADIQQETGWGPSELATQLSMRQSMVSKFLAFSQRLAPEVQGLLATGALDMEKAYLVSQVDDHAAQVAMVKESAHLSRDELRAKVKRNGQAQPKTKRAVFLLPGGMSVTVVGRDSDLPEIVEVLSSLIKELRKGIGQGLTVNSAQRVLKDKAKA